MPGSLDLWRRLQWAGYHVTRWHRRPSPSGTGTHIKLWVVPEPSSAMEVVALQAILGSDPYREASNLGRVRVLDELPEYWRTRWNVLYSE